MRKGASSSRGLVGRRRQELLTLRPRRLERGRRGIRSDAHGKEVAPAGARVGEVRHAVGAHAPGERECPRAAGGGRGRRRSGRVARRDALVVFGELPPQPAIKTPPTSSRGRAGALVVSGSAARESMPSCIGSPSGVLRVCESVVGDDRFPDGFARPETGEGASGGSAKQC